MSNEFESFPIEVKNEVEVDKKEIIGKGDVVSSIPRFLKKQRTLAGKIQGGVKKTVVCLLAAGVLFTGGMSKRSIAEAPAPAMDVPEMFGEEIETGIYSEVDDDGVVEGVEDILEQIANTSDPEKKQELIEGLRELPVLDDAEGIALKELVRLLVEQNDNNADTIVSL